MSTSIKEKPSCNPAENSQPLPLPAGVPTTCRCCGGQLDIKWQLNGKPNKAGYWILTCWNKTCGIYGITRSAPTYLTFDLAPYLETEQSS